MKNILLIISSVLLNAFAQLFLKKGMLNIGAFSFNLSNIVPIGALMLKNAFLYLGFLCYAVSIFIWLLVLSKVEVSYAYPFLSIGYIVTAIIAYCAFNENLSITRITGIVVICIGVILISKS